MNPTETRTAFEDETKAFMDIGNLTSDTWLRISNRIDNSYYLIARELNDSAFRTDLSVTASTAGTVISTLGTFKAKDCGVFLTQDGDKTLEKLTQTRKGDKTIGWWWDDSTSTLMFTGDTTETYIVSYIPKRTVLTQSTEMLVPFDEYPEVLIRVYQRAVELWRKGKNLKLDDITFRNAWDEMLDNLKREPNDGLVSNQAHF